ncbi:MAG: molybdopterin molybdotransferase MoeA [Bacteroidota bacterium]
MIAVEEALKIIADQSKNFGTEEVRFNESIGRILSEDIKADRDFPPFNRAAMDGITISIDDWKEGMRSFPISGEQFAGAPIQELKRGTCLEIMTGAVVPSGANVVIRYEDTQIENGKATVTIDEVKDGLNIHPQGKDAKADDLLIPTGKKINYGDIGILVTVGKQKVKVKALPRIAIISTGDELVDVDQTPLPHQIRKSNVNTLAVLLDQMNIDYEDFHINDEWEEIQSSLSFVLEKYDVVLMSGGVSMGKRDFIPDVLEKLHVKKHFHRIAQRPGKPLWFGSNENTTVFGFPGNPVSTLVCFTVYFKHWLDTSVGNQGTEEYATLSSDVRFEKELTYFVSVAVSNQKGVQSANPSTGHGSGDMVNMSLTNAYLALPSDKKEFKEGEVYPLYRI